MSYHNFFKVQAPYVSSNMVLIIKRILAISFKSAVFCSGSHIIMHECMYVPDLQNGLTYMQSDYNHE